MTRKIWSAIAAICLIWLLPQAATAQQIQMDFGEGSSLTNTSIQLIALITVLSLAPSIAMMITCFPFIVTVLSIMRQALGLQSAPPNMLIVSLALFLTFFVMEPVFQQAWQSGIVPLMNEEIELVEAFDRSMIPFREFMVPRTNPVTFHELASLREAVQGEELTPDAPLSVLVPSFMLSEITRAFQIGFLIFMPFLIIDLVVSAVLMSMGMMMVPPAMVSLPFKLAFFVVSDGWALVAGNLVRSYF